LKSWLKAPYEDPVCPHQEADTQSNIQQEQTQQELHQLQQELNTKFARTVKLLEERREPRVKSAVRVLCQADHAGCPPHSSGGVFQQSSSRMHSTCVTMTVMVYSDYIAFKFLPLSSLSEGDVQVLQKKVDKGICILYRRGERNNVE